MNSTDPSNLFIGVGQRKYGVTNYSSKTPIIGTSNVSCCVVVTAYDPASKIAALGHLDAVVISEKAVMTIIESVPPKENLEIAFICGWDDPDSRVNKCIGEVVAKLTKENPLWKINTNMLFVPDELNTYGYVGIDSRTGVVTRTLEDVIFSNSEAPQYNIPEKEFYTWPLLQTVNERPLNLS